MKQLYADIIVDISNGNLDRTFQYEIPQELMKEVHEGSKVRVPFGKGNRSIEGYVVGISEIPAIEKEKIRSVESRCVDTVTVQEKLISLASWIKTTYGSTFIQALKTVLPIKQKKKSKEKRLIVAGNADIDEIIDICKKKNHKARLRLFEELKTKGQISWEEAVSGLSLSSSMLKALEEKGIIKIERSKVYRTGISGTDKEESHTAINLNEEQNVIYNKIRSEFESDERKPCILRGITGSGKTHIYMKLIEDVINEGKQAILLIPEISLTWQTVSRFCKCFGNRTAVMHSRLTPGERSDLLERISKDEISLVIGPRSALFVPLNRLGLIIIDEEHDRSYQSEKSPRYHARETAVKRAQLENAAILMGSATVSLESRYRCDTGEYKLFELKNRFAKAQMPETEIVDMRKELAQGRKSAISKKLEEEIESCLSRKEQVMLFLNRRGYTGFFSCRSCGNVIKCPHCDVALTLHNNNKMICHYCGYSQPAVKLCPSCGSPYIGGFKTGTQQIEAVLKKRFPEANILRMDRDTTTKKESYEMILKSFADGKADILIGTQMIVKGHDFPKVTLVGVIAADISLYASDYRAAETTFQLLVQASGRAGRGKLAGKAIIQTYSPEHYAVKAALAQDYDTFYKEEIANRKIMGYPPISCLLTVHAGAADITRLENAMRHIKKFADSIVSKETFVLGPVNENLSKAQDVYRMAVYIKDADISETVRIRQYIEKYIKINKGFDDINIQFSMND